MRARRVDLQVRTRVVTDKYCPRCLTATDREGMSPALRLLYRASGLRLTLRWCAWCGWRGLRRH